MRAPSIYGLKAIKGTLPDLNSLIGQKIMVLELWATWCPPCRSSIPHLTSLAQQYKHRDVIFVGITDENEQTATKFVNQMGSKMDYIVAIDTQTCMHTYSSQFHAEGIPAAFIIDYKGDVKGNKAFHPMDSAFENALDVCANELRIHKMKQSNTSAETQQKMPDFSKASYDEINKLSIKQLKDYMTQQGIDASQCIEKSDMIKTIQGRKAL